MKRKIIFTIIALLLTQATAAFAAPIDYPGISDEYQYKEVLFITGEPVELSGTVKVTEKGIQGLHNNRHHLQP